MFKKFWRRHKIISVLGVLLLIFALVIAAGAFWLHGRIEDSLPRLEGQLICTGLDAEVVIDRDNLGVPTIQAESLSDAYFAEGFLHAQERFFEMDLCRRFSSGELSELLGESTLSVDRAQRTVGYRRHARAMAESLDPKTRQQFESYVRGVNVGLGALGDVPPEYLLLGEDPKPWLLEDTMLIAFFFFDALSYNVSYEKNLGPMKEALAPALYEFLTPDVTTFDEPMADELGAKPLPIPGPDVIDLRDGTKREPVGRDIVQTFDTMGIGSNNWAVAGRRSEDGKAILANDPHLRASIPGSWYRLQLRWQENTVTGLSAPGAPGVLIGENRHVAWGFTNGMADHEDLVVVEVDPKDKASYLTSTGKQSFEFATETIRIARGSANTLKLRKTIWGPVVGKDWLDRPLALKTTALDAATHNLSILNVMFAKDVDEAILAASSWYGPSQNVLIADSQGHIAWVLSGYLAKRVGYDGKAPRSWAKGDVAGQGQVVRPQIRDPASGGLFPANNRVVDHNTARTLSRVWVPAWRARRIGSLLEKMPKHTLKSLASIQLDTLDEQYLRIQDLVKTDIDLQFSDAVAKAANIIGKWDGFANLDTQGLHVLKIFTERLREAVFAPLLAACASLDDDFVYNWPLKDEPLFALLNERPIHLLAPKYESWHAMINDVFRNTVADIVSDVRFDLDSTWSAARPTFYHHPMGRLPIVGGWLNMKTQGLPGDANTVRAQGVSFGASMRLVVAPGEVAKGLFQMPGGQSGHYKSPHYGDQHSNWVHGRSTPFAPGKSQHRLTLVPQK